MMQEVIWEMMQEDSGVACRAAQNCLLQVDSSTSRYTSSVASTMLSRL